MFKNLSFSTLVLRGLLKLLIGVNKMVYSIYEWIQQPWCWLCDGWPPGAGHSHQSDGQQAGGSADLQWFDPQAWQCTPGNSKTTKRKLILLLILTSP